jgi:hypothetical protein
VQAAVVYIAEVRIPPWVAAKIREKHNITEEEVRESSVLTRVISSGWKEDRRGRRVVLTGTTYAGRRLNVALSPINPGEGIWRLITTHPVRTS